MFDSLSDRLGDVFDRLRRHMSIVIVVTIVAIERRPNKSATMALVKGTVAPQDRPSETPAASMIVGSCAWRRIR